MAQTLNELVNTYLKENGIKITFFANYIQEDYTAVQKWLKGRYNLRPDKIKEIHRFLANSHKSTENIYKEE